MEDASGKTNDKMNTAADAATDSENKEQLLHREEAAAREMPEKAEAVRLSGAYTAEQYDLEDRLPRKRKRWKAVLLAAVLTVFLCVGIAAGLGLYVAAGFSPVKASNQEVQITIPKGASSKDIAGILSRNGLVKDAFLFSWYLRLHHEGTHLQAGKYALRPGMTLDAMIAKLQRGDTVKAQVVKVTIPEGYTVTQIADTLSAAHLIDKQKFLKLCNEPKQFDAYSVVYIPNDPKMKFALEGYLFPDTYDFQKGMSEKDIINRMLLNFDRKINSLPADWRTRLKETGLTFHQMLTVASLIEREVVVPEERPKVASVIYNRLHKPMKLQMDCTIQYILGKQKSVILDKDTKIKDPYNTYENPGLPPGPIASPSLSAIKAALYPDKTDYYYYVTKKDGSHEHYFAHTYSEQLKNIRKSDATAAAKKK